MKKFNFDFIGNKKIFFGISLGLFAIGIIFNFIFGTQLNIAFTGGAVVKYSYVGDIDETNLENTIQNATKKTVTIVINKNIISSVKESHNEVSVEFSGNEGLSLDEQKALTSALEENFPDNGFEQTESSSINPSMGHTFFLKCIAAVIIASVLMVLYVAFRFRKIGGLSAGVMAVIALLHDVIIVYFTFIVFKLSIGDSFIAVTLMILGYSLNDTIVIYDRIRENRKRLGPKKDVGEIVNLSINQTLGRTINTSITTAAAIGTVLVVSIVFKLSSVTTFALPMLVGIISGCYSTISIAGPLWVMWQNHKRKKLKEQKTK